MVKSLIKYGLKHVFIRFILVGALNTAFGVGTYLILIYFGVPYAWAVMISTILGVLFNFKTLGILVFNNRKNSLIVRFVLCYVVAYFVNIGLIALMLKFMVLNEYYAGICATPVVALLSFFMQRKFVYGSGQCGKCKIEDSNE